MLTYEEFLEDYKRFIGCLTGQINLPQGYFQNWRGWDMYQCLKYGKLGPGDEILDTGAMHTFGCLYWDRNVRHVTALDNFSWAERKYSQGLMTPFEWQCVIEHWTQPDYLTVEHGDLHQLRYPDPRFHKILCISTIEHVIDDRLAMSEMYRVLRPDGKLLLTTEYHEENAKPYSEEDNSFYRVYNHETFDALVEGYNVTARIVEKHEPFDTIFVCIEKEAL